MSSIDQQRAGGDASPELIEGLAADDELAWGRLWPSLLPAAMQLVSAALGSEAETSHLRGQVEALDWSDRADDAPPTHNANAALWSACSSFRRHFCKGEMQDARDLEQLACQLIRIAYNRWQRQRRRAVRLRREVARGGGRPDLRASALDGVQDGAAGPSMEAELSELRESVRNVVKEVFEGLKELYRRIVALYLNGLESGADKTALQRKIARAVGCSQATVSRVIKLFHNEVRRRLKSDGDDTSR
jgi:DNA-directed RNA polymerase specialized sigma24 family protein